MKTIIAMPKDNVNFFLRSWNEYDNWLNNNETEEKRHLARIPGQKQRPTTRKTKKEIEN